MGSMLQKVPWRAVLIAGPTASGKSGLALRLAERIGGVVVNADSMQVYRDLRVVTSRPSPADEARAPHRLYGHVDGAEAYSVGRWLGEATAVLSDARAGGRVAIVVGGTGLYFQSLEEGLSAIPDVPDEMRARWRAALAERGSTALHDTLATRDPRAAAMLRPSDAQRVVRALEVLEATGRSLADWHAEGSQGGPLAGLAVPRLVLMPERARLHERINARFEAMMEEGAFAEVAALKERGLDPDRPVMKAIGVPELMRHLDGEMTLREAVERAKTQTRRYAKRQTTWLRHRMADWPRLDPEHFSGDPDGLVDAVIAKNWPLDRRGA